jgi:hypothetical protein
LQKSLGLKASCHYPESMSFEALEAPFSSVEGLGCRNLLWGQRLVLDLFEYLQSGPAENADIAGKEVAGGYLIGLTGSSRIWRLTFEHPFAVRVRDESLRFIQPKTERPPLPSPYCFTKDSAWLTELFPDPLIDPRLGDLDPTHYLFALFDDFIEIVADDSPTIEEIENDIA